MQGVSAEPLVVQPETQRAGPFSVPEIGEYEEQVAPTSRGTPAVIISENFSGYWVDITGRLVLLEQVNNVVLCSNPRDKVHVTLTEGMVIDNELSMFGLVGRIDGECIKWSDDTQWLRTSDIRAFTGDTINATWGKITYGPPVSEFPPPPGGIKGLWISASVNMKDMLPRLFLYFAMLLFLYPICLLIYVCRDWNIKLWVARNFVAWWLLLLPLAYLIIYVIHWCRGQTYKTVVVLTLLVSSATLFLASCLMMSTATWAWVSLAATDCETWTEKRDLEIAYRAASTFFDNCIAEKVARTHATSAEALEVMRIEDCSGYDDQLDTYPDWKYLDYLETNLHCGGWCTAKSISLWSFSTPKDSCSDAVAYLVREKGEGVFFLVTAYALVVLAFTSFILLLGSPLLVRLGMI